MSRPFTAVMLALIITGCNTAEMPYRDLAAQQLQSPEARAAAAPVAAVGGRAASPAPPAAVPVLTADVQPAAQRQIIYNAALALVVPDILAAQHAIQEHATSAGGYLQEIDGNAISIRIPAARFDITLSAIEKLGETTHRHVKANDVTEDMRDLAIRLDNAEQVRKRLTNLLAKSEKMDDTIKLEQELERVTQTLELLKGKLQYMQDQVAFSTIRVDLNSPRPQITVALAVPFAWVKDLADGVVAGTSQPVDADRFWKRNDRFALPPGFVRYYERDGTTEAMSADEVVIKLRRQDNYDGGNVDFWSKLARRALVENRAIAIDKESDIQVKDGSAARLLHGIKDLGSRKQAYLIGIVSTPRYVYTFEAWGDADKLPQPALEQAFTTLDVRHW